MSDPQEHFNRVTTYCATYFDSTYFVSNQVQLCFQTFPVYEFLNTVYNIFVGLNYQGQEIKNILCLQNNCLQEAYRLSQYGIILIHNVIACKTKGHVIRCLGVGRYWIFDFVYLLTACGFCGFDLVSHHGLEKDIIIMVGLICLHIGQVCC